MRAIGKTGLTLCHWVFREYEPGSLGWPESGAVFTLTDLAGRHVWTLPLLRDYTDEKSALATKNLEKRFERMSAILSTGPDARFSIWHVREGKDVAYAIEGSEDVPPKWKVTEVDRRPHK